ncbi:MAG TPA: Holliday junction resolvase RuvX, partial [bacterium]
TVSVPVDVQDERLSTAEAERSLIAADMRRRRRRAVRDAVAAAIMLQTYLDRRR